MFVITFLIAITHKFLLQTDMIFFIISTCYCNLREKTFEEIALEEGCTYQCVQRSVYRAVTKIKNILEKL